MTDDRRRIVEFNAAVAERVTRGEAFNSPEVAIWPRGIITDDDDVFGDTCECAQCRSPKVVQFPARPGAPAPC